MLALFLLFAADPVLVPGQFGNALDAAVSPLAFAGDVRYRTPPLTVECWAKLASKKDFNVLVACDDKTSADHWELYSYSGSGRLAAYLPGYDPSEVISKTPIVDAKWHHVAMTFDGKTVALYRDGKLVHEQAVKKRCPGLKPDPGPLLVGMALEGSRRIGCDGLIDDVRISRVVRKIKLPTAALVADADTVAVWPFDDGSKILADPAWTPPPAVVGEKWERMSDPDWVDPRLRKMNTGSTFDGTMAYPLAKDRVLVYKGTAIRVGDKGEAGVIFDRSTLRLAVAWTGGYLQHSDRRFGLLNTPTPAGKEFLVLTAAGPGWAGPKGEASSTHPPTAPLPHDWGRYNGLYMHGKRVILSYSVQGVEVLDSPWLETVGDAPVLTRTVEIAPSKVTLELLASSRFAGTTLRVIDPTGQCRTRERGDQTWVVIPPSAERRRLFLATFSIPADRVAGVLDAPKPDLREWIKPGPSHWPIEVVTRGQLAKDDAPYVVDTLTVPYANPYNALFFCTGLDFLPDGRLAVCTCHGDVWTVSFDEKLDKVAWRRYATGLYHPLGLKVIDGKVVVLERGQLTRLHGEAEAYHYENVCHDWHTGSGEHSYDTCLETDADGNFYFFKTGDTHLPHGGCLLRVSKDGKRVEVFSTGFRHPIGLGVGPDGSVTGADQEGNWMPVTRVDLYRKGGFYGDMRAHHRPTPPKTYDLPLAWLPKDVDNSAGGQVWVPHDRFGLPRGQMLHLSYGRCKVYAMHRQRVEDQEQGAAVDLGVMFLSGTARGRFHPTDGALYVCGLNGWQTAAKKDGCVQRLRYTGMELPFALSHKAFTDGIHLRYARKLDADAVRSGWLVEQWDYRWSADYGSKRWKIRTPGREGVDRLEVTGVTLDGDGKGVFLAVKDMRPAMQMRVGHAPTKTVIHSTVHRLEKR